MSFSIKHLVALCIVLIFVLDFFNSAAEYDAIMRNLSTNHHTDLHSQINLFNFVTLINATIDPVVDASLPAMAKAYHPGNLCPLRHKVLSKMMKGETVDVLIIGGSVTYGAELKDRLHKRWSYPFSELLNSKWYNGSFNVNNIAIGACNIDTWIYKVSTLPIADIIIIDLSVNDQGFDLQALPHFYRTFIQLLDKLPHHPALYFHLAYRSALREPNEINGHCPGANQSIVFPSGIMFCKRWWEMSSYVALVLKEYQVPHISYRDLTWPDYFHSSDQLEYFWNGLSHPDEKAHRLMAKLIAFGLYLSLKAAAHTTSCLNDTYHYIQPGQHDDGIQPLCKHPITQMMATDEKTSEASFRLAEIKNTASAGTGGSAVGGAWKFDSDSKQKYGYILRATKCTSDCLATESDRTLSLAIELSEDPVIQIYYLKSFTEDMGVVSVWIDDLVDSAIQLDGKWSLRVSDNLAFEEGFKIPFSVARVVTLSRNPFERVSSVIKGDHMIIPSMRAGKHILHISARTVDMPTLKWKLIGVTTC